MESAVESLVKLLDDLSLLPGAYFSKLSWKSRGASYKTTILHIGPSMGFHVNLREGKELGIPKAPYRHGPERGYHVITWGSMYTTILEIEYDL